MRDLVLDMLGIDIDTTTKQDLHKEHADEALSVQAWTPEPQIVRQFRYSTTENMAKLQILILDFKNKIH